MRWPQTYIGDLVRNREAEIQTGPFGTQLKASDYTREGTPVINVRNIGYRDIRAESLEFIPDRIKTRLKQHVLAKEDIVFGRKGAVDRHAIISEEQVGWVQGSDCIRLRLTSDRLDPQFLSYSLLSETHKKWMLTQASNKATMASLNHDVISRICVSMPPLPVQQQIIRVISQFGELIENNRRRIALLERAARLLYEEWFVRLRFPGHEHAKFTKGLPEGWKPRTFIEVVEVAPKTPIEKGRGSKYIPMSSLSTSGMTADAADFEERSKPTNVHFMNGDTLLAGITPCLENGKTAFVNFLEDGEVASGSTEFIVLRGKEVSPFFTYCLARSENLRGCAIVSMIGASGRQRVQESCFNGYPVPLAPDSLLRNFDGFAEPAFRQIQKLTQANQKLAASRDLLLPRLMSGEVEV